MNAEATFFDAARQLKRELTNEGLSQAEVDIFNAIIAKWQPVRFKNPTALADSSLFYGSVRNGFGALKQDQVDGINAVLQAMAVEAWPIVWAAYGLATAWHETAATMLPVREAFWKDEPWRERNLRYFPWYGRGLVQLTWEKNYRHADDALGLGGELIADPDVALKEDVAAKIMVRGMAEGWFTGCKCGDFLPTGGKAGRGQFELARRIINGTDKAGLIAGYAVKFQSALEAGGWA